MSQKNRSFFGESSKALIGAGEEGGVLEAERREHRLEFERGRKNGGGLTPRQGQDDIMNAQNNYRPGGRAQEKDGGRELDAVGRGEEGDWGQQQEEEEEEEEEEEDELGAQKREEADGVSRLQIHVDEIHAPPSPEADAPSPSPPDGKTATTASPTASIEALRSNSQPNTSDRRRPPSSISSGFSSSSESQGSFPNLRVSRGGSSMASSSRASTMASQLGSKAWSHGLGSPGSTPRPQPLSTFFAGGSGDDRRGMLSESELESEGKSTPDTVKHDGGGGGGRGQEEDGEEEAHTPEKANQYEGEEAKFTGKLLAAAAAALSQISGESRPAPFSLEEPTPTTAGNSLPPPPPPQLPRPTMLAGESGSGSATAAAAAAAPALAPGMVVVAEEAGEAAVSPAPCATTDQEQPGENTRAVGGGGGVGSGVEVKVAVITLSPSASSEDGQRKPRSAFSCAPSPPQQQPEPPLLRSPPPSPPPEPEKGSIITPNEEVPKPAPPRVPSSPDTGKTAVQACTLLTEEEGNKRSPSPKVAPSARSIDGAFRVGGAATEKGVEQAAAAAAKDGSGEETKVDSAERSLRAASEPIPNGKTKSVAAKATPAAAPASATATPTVSEATKVSVVNKEDKKWRVRSAFGFRNMSSSAGGRVGPRVAGVGAAPPPVLWQKHSSAPPAPPPALPSAMPMEIPPVTSGSVKPVTKAATNLGKATKDESSAAADGGGGDYASGSGVNGAATVSGTRGGAPPSMLPVEEKEDEDGEGGEEAETDTQVYTETVLEHEFWRRAREEDSRAGEGVDAAGRVATRGMARPENDAGTNGGTVEQMGGKDRARPTPPNMHTLVEAVESGDPSAVGAVVTTVGKEQAVLQLSALRVNDDGRLETIAMMAARSGDLEMFRAVLRSLERTLSVRQIAEVLEAKGSDESSLLTAAAEGGNEIILGEVSGILGGMDKTGTTLISEREARCLMKMAAKSGKTGVFNKAMDTVLWNGKRSGAKAIAASEGSNETSVLVEAAASGSGAMIDLVLATMYDLLKEDQVVATVTSCAGPRRMSALMVAAETRSVKAVTAVVKAVSAIGNGAGITDAASDSSATRSVVFVSNQKGVTASLKLKARAGKSKSTTPANLGPDRHRNMVIDMIMAKDVLGMTALSYATSSGSMEIIKIVAESMHRCIPAGQMLEMYSSSLANCCKNLPSTVDRELLDVISYLLQHGAKPGTLGLIRLSTRVQYPLLKESLLGAVSSARNPFIPGMNLSVALSGAARRAVEGEKRALLSMQAAVDELLLEVLEHLPQTVRGFEGEMKACSAVFEPEAVISSYKGMMGPLSVALQKRQQMETYCTIPLVLDFMSRKFTKGLPSLRDSERVLENDKELSNAGQTLYGDGLMAEGRILFLGMALQRGYGGGRLSTITYFPGARFVIAGLLSRPDSYYKVPALRMVLDLVTYLCMMGVFGGFVLLHEDDKFDWSEIVFGIYILGAILTEFREIGEDPWEYVRDRWNVLDVTSLCFMVVSLCFRAFDHVDSIAARSLYALSAPLAFTRILFFAQILPSQGPMIQVIFSMTGELVKFGMVMLVVMGGFVMSFYSLFKRDMSYGEVWQEVFKAMLGETEFFDEFSGTPFDTVATILLATYLVIMTIMMLNLLVAVLSTAHARVEQNADQEYKVSKARLIQHYVSVVETDRLPAPFNIVQWVVGFPTFVTDWCFSTKLHKDVKRFFGRCVFWAMLGPVAVATGWLLWMASVLKAATVVWRTSAGNTLGGKMGRVSLAVACCIVGAPVWLLVLWIKGGLTGLRSAVARLSPRRGRVCCGGDSAGKARRLSFPDQHCNKALGDESEDVVGTMLREAEGGLAVSDLQRYLDDPMSDPDVRRDEETRATTVEHVKLLRNRLEATTKEHMIELRSYLVKATEDLSRQAEHAVTATGDGNGRDNANESGTGELKDVFNTRFSELDRKLDARTAKLEGRIESLIDERLSALVQKLDVVLGKPAE